MARENNGQANFLENAERIRIKSRQLSALEASRAIVSNGMPKIFIYRESIRKSFIDRFIDKPKGKFLATAFMGDALHDFQLSRVIIRPITEMLSDSTLQANFEASYRSGIAMARVLQVYCLSELSGILLQNIRTLKDVYEQQSAFKKLEKIPGFLNEGETVPEAIQRVTAEVFHNIDIGNYDDNPSAKMEALLYLSSAQVSGYIDITQEHGIGLQFHEVLAKAAAELYERLETQYQDLDQYYYSGLLNVFSTLEYDLYPQRGDIKVADFLEDVYAPIKERVFPGTIEHIRNLGPQMFDDGIIRGPKNVREILIDTAREKLGLAPVERIHKTDLALQLEAASGSAPGGGPGISADEYYDQISNGNIEIVPTINNGAVPDLGIGL